MHWKEVILDEYRFFTSRGVWGLRIWEWYAIGIVAVALTGALYAVFGVTAFIAIVVNHLFGQRRRRRGQVK